MTAVIQTRLGTACYESEGDDHGPQRRLDLHFVSSVAVETTERPQTYVVKVKNGFIDVACAPQEAVGGDSIAGRPNSFPIYAGQQQLMAAAEVGMADDVDDAYKHHHHHKSKSHTKNGGLATIHSPTPSVAPSIVVDGLDQQSQHIDSRHGFDCVDDLFLQASNMARAVPVSLPILQVPTSAAPQCPTDPCPGVCFKFWKQALRPDTTSARCQGCDRCHCLEHSPDMADLSRIFRKNKGTRARNRRREEVEKLKDSTPMADDMSCKSSDPNFLLHKLAATPYAVRSSYLAETDVGSEFHEDDDRSAQPDSALGAIMGAVMERGARWWRNSETANSPGRHFGVPVANAVPTVAAATVVPPMARVTLPVAVATRC